MVSFLKPEEVICCFEGMSDVNLSLASFWHFLAIFSCTVEDRVVSLSGSPKHCFKLFGPHSAAAVALTPL